MGWLTAIIKSVADSLEQTSTARMLIEQKYRYLQTIAQVTMLWWVSTIAFASTVIYGALEFRGTLQMLPIWEQKSIFYLLTIVLAVNVIYVAWAIAGLIKLRRDIRRLLEYTGFPTTLSGMAEFTWTIIAIINAAGGFIAMIALWILISMWVMPLSSPTLPTQNSIANSTSLPNALHRTSGSLTRTPGVHRKSP